MVIAHPTSTELGISDPELVLSRIDTFGSLTTSMEASGEIASRKNSVTGKGVGGKPFDSWKHLLDAMGGGLPSFLSSSTFAVFLNARVIRSGLKVLTQSIEFVECIFFTSARQHTLGH